MDYTVHLGMNFVKGDGEERQGAQSDVLRSFICVLRTEIGKRMSTDCVQFTMSGLGVKTLNWETNSLNRLSIKFGVIFVLRTKGNGC